MKKYIPETLKWCETHFVPKIEKYISCENFGKCDGMSGGCWWCKEMTPYQWHMCFDELTVSSLMKSSGMNLSREKAEEFIEKRKAGD